MLIHELQNITLIVTAQDNGNPEPFFSSVTVIIMVFSPDNFFSPELDQTTYRVTIDENERAGSSILRFTMSDRDQPGPSSEIGEASIFGDDARFFTVRITGPNTGEILSKYESV